MKLIPIKTKKIYHYNGIVYDLSVEEDHTYNVNGFIVHNSDYVMIGSLFNKAIESAGFNYLYGIKLSNKVAAFLWKQGFPIKKKYRGMSTKSVQKSWGKTKLVTSEGITKYQNVEYDLTKWTDNFKDYLRSCMSYCGDKNLSEFIGEAEWQFITYNALLRYKK